jgi:hypothetical protein
MLTVRQHLQITVLTTTTRTTQQLQTGADGYLRSVTLEVSRSRTLAEVQCCLLLTGDETNVDPDVFQAVSSIC